MDVRERTWPIGGSRVFCRRGRREAPPRWLVVAILALVMPLPVAVAPAEAAVPVNVYRFYNISNGAHFYTVTDAERVDLWTRLSNTYRYEGVVWTVDAASPAANQPLHRFYNLVNGSHFYTASEAEKRSVITALSSVYRYEGVAYNVTAIPAKGAIPVYRFYHRSLGSHFYTSSAMERDQVIANLSSVYSYEGPAFYVPVTGQTGYDYAAAVAYAERWSSNSSKPRNPAYDDPDWDCCNFVSQSLHDGYGGKKPFDCTGANEAQQWWTKKTWFGWDSTMSWVNSSFSYNYMMENPSGVYIATWDWVSATSYPVPPAYTPQGFAGDLLYYDWDGNGSKDHVGIRVGVGRDPVSGLSGDLTDQHTSDRQHAIWHLLPSNDDWRTTRITMVRPL